MKGFYKTSVVLATAFSLMFMFVFRSGAAGPKVSQIGNKHNLSAKGWNAGTLTDNTNLYRAVNDPINNPGGQQICIFCHTPHNSMPQGPLWNRKDTTQTFARYTSTTMKMKDLPDSQYYKTGEDGGQPNGSSRLCLSCHDGVTGLGDVIRSGQNGPIQMLGGNNIPQADVASFHPSNNKMKNGHHPVSFVYATNFDYKLQTGTMIGLDTNKFVLPKNNLDPSLVNAVGKVKLLDSKRDRRGWMQCTTCHDAHQNMGNDGATYPATTRKITPFWVYSSTNGTSAANSHDDVCNSCHKLSVTTPAPWITTP